jgi:hypothetical protein
MYGPARKDTYRERELRRLFLEYCPGGDIGKLLEREGRATITPTNLLWKLMFGQIFIAWHLLLL